jgi:hypothetical protein
MSLLGDLLPKAKDVIAQSLPTNGTTTVEGIGNAISEKATTAYNFIKDGTTNFSLASAADKISEVAGKVVGSFGNLNKFKSLGGNVATKTLTNAIPILGGGKSSQLATNKKGGSGPRNNNSDVIVKLRSTLSNEVVEFAVSPRISESASAQYAELQLVHHPGSILKYERTSSRSFSLGVKLVSRTQAEATKNQQILNIIRSWIKPFYGKGTEAENAKMLGAPPPVLMLSGYGLKNISPIPVVLENYSAPWPNDVDYIPTLTGDPFPVILELDLSLKESYSPAEFSNFNLYKYKTGDLTNAFSAPATKNAASPAASAANKVTSTSETASLKNIPLGAKVPSVSDLTSPAVNNSITPAANVIKDKTEATASVVLKNNAQLF